MSQITDTKIFSSFDYCSVQRCEANNAGEWCAVTMKSAMKWNYMNSSS